MSFVRVCGTHSAGPIVSDARPECSETHYNAILTARAEYVPAYCSRPKCSQTRYASILTARCFATHTARASARPARFRPVVRSNVRTLPVDLFTSARRVARSTSLGAACRAGSRLLLEPRAPSPVDSRWRRLAPRSSTLGRRRVAVGGIQSTVDGIRKPVPKVVALPPRIFFLVVFRGEIFRPSGIAVAGFSTRWNRQSPPRERCQARGGNPRPHGPGSGSAARRRGATARCDGGRFVDRGSILLHADAVVVRGGGSSSTARGSRACHHIYRGAGTASKTTVWRCPGHGFLVLSSWVASGRWAIVPDFGLRLEIVGHWSRS